MTEPMNTQERTEVPVQVPATVIHEHHGGGLISILTFMVALVAAVMAGLGLWMQLPQETVVEEVPLEEVAVYVPQEGVDFILFSGNQIPILDDVEKNSYDIEAFAQADGYITYENAAFGVDVSQHQGEIDWAQVAEAGAEFAIIRLGYRGYGEEGNIHEDTYFRQNIEGAQAAGLQVGVYFFSQATSVWEAKEEAYFVEEALEGYELTYPVVFDWEYITATSDARTAGTLGRSVTLYAQAFCEEIAQAGYQPMVYFNMDVGYLHLDLSQLTDYPFWLASYRDAPNFYYHFDIWQYSHTGTVPGIEGDVDMNLAFWSYPTETQEEQVDLGQSDMEIGEAD